MHWTEDFFDEYYLKSIDRITGKEQTDSEVNFLIEHSEIDRDGLILDLACGHGRHAIELAGRGFTHVTGMDLAIQFLNMAKENAAALSNPPQFIHKNMNDFEETDKYDLIYSLFSSLFYFDDKRNLEILKRVHAGLNRDGYLIIDYFNPIEFLKRNRKRNWFFTSDEYLILDEISHNPISGIITNERQIITPEGKRIKRMFHVRDYTVAELRYHLENIGFEIINVFGNFDSSPFTIRSPRQIFVMKKTI
ncbi:MAG: class I SAM-dependent methyltransferase [Calditrichaceae bacterium]